MSWVSPLDLNLLAHGDGFVEVSLEGVDVFVQMPLLVLSQLHVEKNLLTVDDWNLFVVLDAHA